MKKDAKNKPDKSPPSPKQPAGSFGEYLSTKIEKDLKSRDYKYRGRAVSLERFRKSPEIQENYFLRNKDTIKGAQSRYKAQNKFISADDIEKIRENSSYKFSNKFQGADPQNLSRNHLTHFKPMHQLDPFLEQSKNDDGREAKLFILKKDGKILGEYDTQHEFKTAFYSMVRAGKISYEDAAKATVEENFLTNDSTVILDVLSQDEDEDEDEEEDEEDEDF